MAKSLTHFERAGGADPEDAALGRVMRWIELLTVEIGPRRPTGAAERLAAEHLRGELAQEGLGARLEPFRGYPSFLWPYGSILGAGLAPALIHRVGMRCALAVAAAGALISEGGLIRTPLSDALSRRRSQNLVATVEPSGEPDRTLCLVGHLDSSRSGLMFHPAVAPYLSRWLSLQAAAVLVGAGDPLLSRRRGGRAILAATRGVLAAGLALLLERELRGEDVPGANDNASGTAVAAALAAEVAASPLARTRLVLLLTGCEESGLLGARSFLREHDTAGWIFLNFDGVGGRATLRFLRREGVFQKWDADPALIAAAEALRERRPELGLEPTDRPAGLTYDVSPVHARGGRALTLSAQDETIPHLHQPSDTIDNIDPDVLARALDAGRELIAAVDRGAVD